MITMEKYFVKIPLLFPYNKNNILYDSESFQLIKSSFDLDFSQFFSDNISNESLNNRSSQKKTFESDFSANLHLYDNFLKNNSFKNKKLINVGFDSSYLISFLQYSYDVNFSTMLWFDFSNDTKIDDTLEILFNDKDNIKKKELDIADIGDTKLRAENFNYLDFNNNNNTNFLEKIFNWKEKINYVGQNKIKKYLQEINETDQKITICLNIDLLNMDDNIENSVKNLIDFLMIIKKKIISFNIFNFKYDKFNKKKNLKIKQIIRLIMINILDIQIKKINIFTENSDFLIYRPNEILNENDKGWFILRGLENIDKEKMLGAIGEKIISIKIEDQEVLVTKTCPKYQYDNTFFDNISIMDKILFPEEKIDMIFELIN